MLSTHRITSTPSPDHTSHRCPPPWLGFLTALLHQLEVSLVSVTPKGSTGVLLMTSPRDSSAFRSVAPSAPEAIRLPTGFSNLLS